MNKDELIKELQEKLEKVSKEKEVLEEEARELEKKVKDLERQLCFFKNPHTPSSKQFFKKRILQASKKLGAPRGHEGATRQTPEPSEVVNHFLAKCPTCYDVLSKPFDFEERIVEEIPEPQPVKITKHVIGFYNCKNCGVVIAETYLPNEGNFGKNFEGIINRDGWETYKSYKDSNDKVLLQCCWAHTTREVEDFESRY